MHISDSHDSFFLEEYDITFTINVSGVSHYRFTCNLTKLNYDSVILQFISAVVLPVQDIFK